MSARSVLLLLTLPAFACGARTGPRTEGSSVSARVPVPGPTAPVSAAVEPDAGMPDAEAGVAAVDDSRARARLSLRAEVVEADTIRVGTLRAITLEAGELRVKDLQRVGSYPVAKDEGMVKLEGHLVEADELEAHHIRARLVVADHAVVHRVLTLRGAAPWPSTAAEPEVVNRCAHMTPRSDGVAARCSRGLAPDPWSDGSGE